VIPARSFLGSKKSSPTYYFDGLQGEITTPPGTTCLEQLSAQISINLSQVYHLAKKLDPNARITLKNHFKFSETKMASFSDEDVAFRCTPSLNIYDDFGQAPDPRDYPYRFAGGHIHIGFTKKSTPSIKAMVRALDGILGVASVSLARNWDISERRRMYGRAGEFRLPKHGLEYRVLSNYWLCSPLIFHLTFELMRYAYRIGESGAFYALFDGTEDEIRSCINHCDVELACKLIERNAGLYSNIFRAIWGTHERASKKAMDTLMNGLEEAVPQPDNIINNWSSYDGSYPMRWGRTFA
jgi:hypothetical protein